MNYFNQNNHFVVFFLFIGYFTVELLTSPTIVNVELGHITINVTVL